MRRAVLPALIVCLAAISCNASDVVLYAPADAGVDAGGSTTAGVGGLTGGGAGGLGGSGGEPSGGSAGAMMADAGAPNEGGTPCVSTADCAATWFCSKLDCRDTLGICTPRPLICDVDLMPVCGCDHITYWNACLREGYGISADRPGECGSNATLCDGDADCGIPGVTCAHLLPPMADCSVHGPGTCWATPNDCAPGSDFRHWLACPLPAPGSPVSCVSTCEAVQSGQTHIQAPRGTQCNQ